MKPGPRSLSFSSRKRHQSRECLFISRKWDVPESMTRDSAVAPLGHWARAGLAVGGEGGARLERPGWETLGREFGLGFWSWQLEEPSNTAWQLERDGHGKRLEMWPRAGPAPAWGSPRCGRFRAHRPGNQNFGRLLRAGSWNECTPGQEEPLRAMPGALPPSTGTFSTVAVEQAGVGVTSYKKIRVPRSDRSGLKSPFSNWE